jgi:tetratricopeptide (TPR) repeat protein
MRHPLTHLLGGIAATVLLGLLTPGAAGAQAVTDSLRAELAAAEAASDTVAIASAANSLGVHHWSASRYDSAVVHLNRARTLWTALDDPAALGRVYNNLGSAHYQWGNYEAALDAFLRALDLRRAVGDARGEAVVLTNVGRTYHDWQQFDAARAALEEGVAVARAAGEPMALGYALHNRGILALTLGSFEEAREFFRSSQEAYDADDARIAPEDRASGWALNILGMSATWTRGGDPARGIALADEALERAVEEGHVRREIRALVYRGEGYRMAGAHPAAVRDLERAIELARSAEQRGLELDALAELALAHEARGAPAQALVRLREHTALRDSIFSQSGSQRIAALEARADAERQERENLRLLEEQRAQEAVIQRQRLVGVVGGALLLLTLLLAGGLVHFNRIGREREVLLAATNEALERTNRELRVALSEVRTLEGLIPICGHCKKVRDDRGFWEGVESYISSRSDAHFSHSICTECGPKLYGEDWAPEEERSGEPGVEATPSGTGTASD